MLSWKVGDVTVTRIMEMENTISYNAEAPFIAGADPLSVQNISWLAPDYATPEGELRMSVHALLIDAPGLKLVVDTCIGNDKPREFLGGGSLNTAFLETFAETGWSREDVDIVICTHLHIDHVGWNTMLVDGEWIPTFPNARYLIGRIEYAHWTSGAEQDMLDQPEIMADSVKPILDAGLADFVELDHKISDEISLFPTTGHTPGHVSVLIESKGQKAIIAGDVMHHPVQIARPTWNTQVDSEVDEATATRMRLLSETADSSVLLIGTHFSPPTAGYIRRDGPTFRFDAAN